MQTGFTGMTREASLPLVEALLSLKPSQPPRSQVRKNGDKSNLIAMITKLSLIGIKVRHKNVYGFVNKITKLHPDMDHVLLSILANDPNGYILILQVRPRTSRRAMRLQHFFAMDQSHRIPCTLFGRPR